MTTILTPPGIRSSHFHYNAATKTLTADMSELAHNGFKWGRVYPDACDEGFTIISDRTGHEAVFVVEHVAALGEDLSYWRLKPARREPRVDPDLRVVIYND